MTDQEAYEDAKTEVVQALVRFLVAGDKAGRSAMEIQSDFMVAFGQAAAEQAAA